MRLIVVLTVLAQSSLYYAVRIQRSYPSPFNPTNQNYLAQKQYGPLPQPPQTFPSIRYTNIQQTSPSLIPQQVLTRPNVHYLPPSQSQKQIKLPKDIDGYQLVHSGYPAAPESNQIEVAPSQNPQSVQVNQQNTSPIQNNFQLPSNYYLSVPFSSNAPCPYSNQLPQNFPPQLNQFQIPSQNGIYQIPQLGYQNGFSPVPQQSLYGPNPLGVQGSPVSQGSGPNQSVTQYQPFTLNQISQDILPFLSPPNLPTNVQNTPIPSPPLQTTFPPNPFLQNPNLSVPINIPQPQPTQPSGLTDFEVTIPAPGNIQNDPLLQLLKQQQSQLQPETVPFNGQGYQIINNFGRSSNIQPTPYSQPQPQQQSPEVNAEGYQVINEGPVTHYVTTGEPNTKIVSLNNFQSPENIQSSFQSFYSSYRSNNDPINIATQTNQPQIINPNVTPQISENQQPNDDCEADSQIENNQSQLPEDIDQIRTGNSDIVNR